MWVGEVSRLDRCDIDWTEATVLICQSKFGKSRRIPLLPVSLRSCNATSTGGQPSDRNPGNGSFFVFLTGNWLI
jgi:integrase